MFRKTPPKRPAPDEVGEYLQPYQTALEAFGPTFEASLWLSRDAQQRRFEILAEMVDLTDLNILDAGCGLGDMAQFLAERSIAFGSYVGIEGLKDVVEAATARALPRARFAQSDFVGDSCAFDGRFPEAEGSRADVILFSGSLNTLDENTARAVVARAWTAARDGVVFNFLSQRNGKPRPVDPTPARRFDPLAMLDWALSQTPRVRFRQDYLDGHDATIAMLRQPVGPQPS